MSVAERIEKTLQEALSPNHLEVIDESHKHAGHVGARPEGETHFHIIVTAGAFDDLNRVARQRMVHQLLADELAGPVHALSMELKSAREG